jgi:hypothetical protein
MNKFLIAVILGALLATSYAFRTRAHSKLQQEDDDDVVISRGDRPMGHTEYTPAEYYGDCDATQQDNINNYSCPSDDQEWEDIWYGVIYCGWQNEYETSTPQKIFDFQLDGMRDTMIEDESEYACVAASTLQATGYYDCDIYTTVSDALAHEQARRPDSEDWQNIDIQSTAEAAVGRYINGFTHWWCAPHTPDADSIGEVLPVPEVDDDDEEVNPELIE